MSRLHICCRISIVFCLSLLLFCSVSVCAADTDVMCRFPMRFSADGTRMAYPTDATEITVFDTFTGKAVSSYSRGSKEWKTQAISPDGRYAITGGFDGYGRYSADLKIWDLYEGKLLQTIPWVGGSNDKETSIAISADGKYAAIARDLSVWDVASGKRVRKFPFRSSSDSIFLSSDGSVVAFAAREGGKSKTYVFDVVMNNVLFQKGGYLCDLSTDGNLLCYHDYGQKKTLVYSVKEKKTVGELPDGYSAGRFLQDGKYVYCKTRNSSQSVVLGLPSGKQDAYLTEFAQKYTYPVQMVISPNGRWVVGRGSKYQKLMCVDMTKKGEPREVALWTGSDFSRDTRFFTVNDEGVITVMTKGRGVFRYDLQSDKRTGVANCAVHKSCLRGSSISPDGKKVVVYDPSNYEWPVSVFNADTGAEVWLCRKNGFRPHFFFSRDSGKLYGIENSHGSDTPAVVNLRNRMILQMEFSKDFKSHYFHSEGYDFSGRRLWSALKRNGKYELVAFEGDKELKTIYQSEKYMSQGVLLNSADGTHFLYAHEHGVLLFDADNNLLKVFDNVKTGGFLPDGGVLLHRFKKLLRYDLQKDEETLLLKDFGEDRHTGVQELVARKDGNAVLLMGRGDKQKLVVVDLSGKEKPVDVVTFTKPNKGTIVDDPDFFKNHPAVVAAKKAREKSVAQKPATIAYNDNSYLSSDGALALIPQRYDAKIVDTATGKTLRTLGEQWDYSLKLQSKLDNAIRISPDGKYVLTWNESGVPTLWDAEKGVKLVQGGGFPDATGRTYGAFSPDGKFWLMQGNEQYTEKGSGRTLSRCVLRLYSIPDGKLKSELKLERPTVFRAVFTSKPGVVLLIRSGIVFDLCDFNNPEPVCRTIAVSHKDYYELGNIYKILEHEGKEYFWQSSPEDGVVVMDNITDGKKIYSVGDRRTKVSNSPVSADGQCFLAAGTSRYVSRVDVRSMFEDKVLFSLTLDKDKNGKPGRIESFAYGPQNTICLLGTDCNLYWFDAQTGKLLNKHATVKTRSRSLRLFYFGGDYISIVCSEGVFMFAREKEPNFYTFKMVPERTRLTKDNKLVFYSVEGKGAEEKVEVTMFNLEAGEAVAEFSPPGMRLPIVQFRFRDGGKKVLSMTPAHNGAVNILDTASGKLLASIDKKPRKSLPVSPVAQTDLYCVGKCDHSKDRRYRLSMVTFLNDKGEFKSSLIPVEDSGVAYFVSPDGRFFGYQIHEDSGGGAVIHERISGQKLLEIKNKGTLQAAISPDSKLCALVSAQKISVYAIPGGEPVEEIKIPEDTPEDREAKNAIWSTHKKHSGYWPNPVSAWFHSGYNQTAPYLPHTPLRFSRDNAYLLYADLNRVLVKKLDKSKTVGIAKLPSGNEILEATFTPDSGALLLLGRDGEFVKLDLSAMKFEPLPLKDKAEGVPAPAKTSTDLPPTIPLLR